jgi:hypothetical protein
MYLRITLTDTLLPTLRLFRALQKYLSCASVLTVVVAYDIILT